MTMIGLIEILFLLFFLCVIPCRIWARIDAKRGVFHPLGRAMIVASALDALLIGFVLVAFLREQTRAGRSMYGASIAWAEVLIGLAVTFVIATLIGSIAYLIRYRFAAKPSSVEGSYGDEEPSVRLEETGNPYQPPST